MSVICANTDWVELAREARYQRRKLAQCCGVSAGYLNQYFVTHFHRTPQKWLDALRISEACRLLCEGASVKEVAYTLGFKQVSHFSRVFSKYHGFCPSECRDRFLSQEKVCVTNHTQKMSEKVISTPWFPSRWQPVQLTLNLPENSRRARVPVEI